MTLRTLNYGNYGIFLIMGNAGFCPSAVWVHGELGAMLRDFGLALQKRDEIAQERWTMPAVSTEVEAGHGLGFRVRGASGCS